MISEINTGYYVTDVCSSKLLLVKCGLLLRRSTPDPRGPGPPHCRAFKITLRHSTLGKTPLDERSARRRDHYLTIHNNHKRHSHAPGGIRTHNPSK